MDIKTRNRLRKIASVVDPQRRMRKFFQNVSGAWAYQSFTISSPENGNDVIASQIASATPASAGKIGATELKLIDFFSKNRPLRPYPDYIREEILVHSGVFPTTDENLDKFAETYLEAVTATNLLSPWHNRGENEIIRNFASTSQLIHMHALEPYYFENPWSQALKNKRVLVVTSFPKTVRSQFERRLDVWRDRPAVLPEFDLNILEAPNSPALTPPSHANWHDVLEDLKGRMAARQYDVALIGAGALALPLGAYSKSDGKVAIHLGGAVQILFGIRGARWDQHPVISKFFNDAWVRPDSTEIPKAAKKVENGAYW